MKNIFLAAMLFTVILSNAQIDNNELKVRAAISVIKIKSKKPLVYSSRGVNKDTIYITIDKWNYEPIKELYKASIIDYIKVAKGYQVINSKSKFFTKAQVDGLFVSLNNSILTSESYSGEMDKLLAKALLLQTQSDLSEDGKTIYSGVPNDWLIPIK